MAAVTWGRTTNESHHSKAELLRSVFSLPNDLPLLNQRPEVKSDNVKLQFDSIVVMNHGAHHGILDFAVVQD